jgi:hypothetical protein
MPAPVSPIISMNSGMDGMSRSPIFLFIMCVAMALMPGRPPSRVGMCIAGLPTVATLMCSMRCLWMASSPKKVKNRLASMPSARAPLAMIRPG